MNQNELRVEKFDDENFLPHGMNFEIGKFEKIDNGNIKVYEQKGTPDGRI